MARVKLTDSYVGKLEPGGSAVTDQESSIRCKKHPSGRVSLTWRYRHKTTRRGRKLTLGAWVPETGDDVEPAYGYVTLTQARVLVARAKLALSQGRDPAAEKLAAKRKRREPDRVDDGSLFPAVAKEFVLRHCKANNQRRWVNVSQTLGILVDRKTGKLSDTFTPGSPCDLWRDVAINALTKRQVLELVDTFVERGHRIAGLARWKSVRRCLRWAVSRDIIPHSPLSDARPPVRSRSRERVLDAVEIRAMWKATLKLGGDYGPYVRFLLLTMTRRNEPLRMPWSELNAERTLWTIPGSRTKNAVTQHCPLSPAAQDILAELPPDRALVFGGLANANINRWKRKLDRLMAAELAKDGHVFRSWVQHDLRRTGATLLAEHGVDAVVVGKLLNHQSALSPIARIYLRATYREPMRKAIELLADKVLEIVAEDE